jgi:hypothetical protein
MVCVDLLNFSQTQENENCHQHRGDNEEVSRRAGRKQPTQHSALMTAVLHELSSAAMGKQERRSHFLTEA